MGDRSACVDSYVDDYVESFHSHNGFSRARLSVERAHAFDDQLTTLVRRSCPDDIVPVSVRARVTWVRPLSAESSRRLPGVRGHLQTESDQGRSGDGLDGAVQA
jgi:hypothetical protein